MKKTNRGKDFEKEIKNSLELVPTASVDRLPDPMGGYSGVRNICDFSVFDSPDNFYLECKCLYGNTLNYSSAISENQWNGMEEKSHISRCIAGVCVWFIDYETTAFIPIQTLISHKNAGYKSLNITDIQNKTLFFISIDGIKKRTMFKYFGDMFLYKLHKLSEDVWKNNKDLKFYEKEQEDHNG